MKIGAPKTKTKILNIRVEDEFHMELKKANIHISAICRQALKTILEEISKKKKVKLRD